MRRITPALAMTAGVALFAAACGGGDGGGTGNVGDTGTDGEATEAPVRGGEDLVIWTNADRVGEVQAVAEAFAEQQEISVGVAAVTDTRANFITANAAGNGPDVVVGAHDWLGQLVTNAAVDPLRLSPDHLGAYSETAIQAVTYDGQIYGVPYGVEALALFCNTDHAAGTFATLEDAITAGQESGAEIPLALEVGESGDPYHWYPLYTSMGGYLFGKNPDGTYNADDLGVGKEGSIAAGQKLAELAQQGILNTSLNGDLAKQKFLDGDAACWISGPWNLKIVRDAGIPFSVQPIPGFAGQQPARPFMGAQAYMVASQGQNKTFAEEFVTNFVNTEEAMELSFENAQLPPSMTSVREAHADDLEVTAFGEAADQADPMPAIPAMDQVWAPLGQAQAAIIGGADPVATMTTAGQTIASALAAG